MTDSQNLGVRRSTRRAGLLVGALALFGGGPASSHPNAVLAWHASNAASAKAGMVLWMLAMLSLVV